MRTIYPEYRWTERRVQKALALWCLDKGHSPVCPNCGVFGWEGDLISVTSSGLSHEFEVKVSFEDFRADFDKTSKHKWLQKVRPSKKAYGRVGPSYFWYAVPRELVAKIQPLLPGYAGLIEIVDMKGKPGWDADLPNIVVNAPRLHDVKIRENDLYYLYRGVSLRFWKSQK